MYNIIDINYVQERTQKTTLKKHRLYPPGQILSTRWCTKLKDIFTRVCVCVCGGGGGSPRCLDQSILGLRKSFCAKDEVDSGPQYCGVFSEVQIFVSIE